MLRDRATSTPRYRAHGRAPRASTAPRHTELRHVYAREGADFSNIWLLRDVPLLEFFLILTDTSLSPFHIGFCIVNMNNRFISYFSFHNDQTHFALGRVMKCPSSVNRVYQFGIRFLRSAQEANGAQCAALRSP